jgi:hypothetical protein
MHNIEQHWSPVAQLGAAGTHPVTQLPDGEHCLPSGQSLVARHSTQR